AVVDVRDDREVSDEVRVRRHGRRRGGQGDRSRAGPPSAGGPLRLPGSAPILPLRHPPPPPERVGRAWWAVGWGPRAAAARGAEAVRSVGRGALPSTAASLRETATGGAAGVADSSDI